MRITHGMIVDTTLRHLSANLGRLERLSTELSSGRRLHKPSDDPVGVATALQHRATLEQLDQHLKNVDEALAWVGITDSALDMTGQVIRRARELASAGANDTLGADERLAIKSEIDNLIQQTAQIANTTNGGQYIFSGTRTTTPAYTTGTPPTFQGNTGAVVREIAPTTTIAVNTDGQATFQPIISALSALSTALAANDGTAINATIGTLDAVESATLRMRADNGARQNRLEAQRSRLLDIQLNVTELRSSVEDTNMAEAIMHFTTAQTVYKAALDAGARSMQPSLMDYLR
jgi:flagellar hook-associated protein 3 FlgL